LEEQKLDGEMDVSNAQALIFIGSVLFEPKEAVG
jgi:hypothetical protein